MSLIVADLGERRANELLVGRCLGSNVGLRGVIFLEAALEEIESILGGEAASP